jgi:iron complex outermembrane receptor protein
MMNTGKKSGTSLVYFSRWTRKSYAVFNSLSKVIKIGRLKLTFSLLTLSTAAVLGQDMVQMSEFSDNVELDELEVTAHSEPLVFAQHGRMITAITQKEIESAPVSDLAGLLSWVQSVDIRQRGSQGVQADISLRGGSFDQVLVLLNGIPVSDPQTGHFNLNLPIHLDDIQRVEVLRGPGARIFGPNAFSGAINIITKANDNNQINARLSAGLHAYYDYGISGNASVKNWNTLVSFNQKASDGYMINTDFRSMDAFLQSSLQLKKLLLDAQLGWMHKEFGANSFYSPKYPMQFEKNQTQLASFGFHFGKKIRVSILPFYRQHRDNWQLTRKDPELYQNFHQTEIYGIRGKSILYSVLGKTNIGFNLKQENLLSSSMGEALEEAQNIAWSPQHQFKYGFQRSHAGIYLEQSKEIFKKWTVSAGVLFHWYSEANQIKLYPGVDISYQISRKWNFSASVNNAMRLPTFTDLFYSGPANAGNPELKAENSLSFELGTEFTIDGLQMNIALFQRQGKDMIDWVWYDSIWRTENITELSTTGVEFSTQISPKDLWNIPFWENLSFDYTYLDMVKNDAGFQSKYALNHLQNQLNLKLQFEPFKNLVLSIKITYRDRLGTYQTYNFETKEYKEHPYQDYILMNSRISYQFKAFQIYAEAQNLNDVSYVESGIPQPGLWLFGGVKFAQVWK